MILALNQPMDWWQLGKMSTLNPVTYSLVGWIQAVDKASG